MRLHRHDLLWAFLGACAALAVLMLGLFALVGRVSGGNPVVAHLLGEAMGIAVIDLLFWPLVLGSLGLFVAFLVWLIARLRH